MDDKNLKEPKRESHICTCCECVERREQMAAAEFERRRDRPVVVIDSAENMLKEFHEAFDCCRNNSPTNINPREILLRIKLIVTEMAELVEAMVDENMVEVFDGICDLNYVTTGTGVAYGLPVQEGLEAVHKNNMTKVGPNGVEKDSAGKVVKPEGYTPVDLRSIIDEHIHKDRRLFP